MLGQVVRVVIGDAENPVPLGHYRMLIRAGLATVLDLGYLAALLGQL